MREVTDTLISEGEGDCGGRKEHYFVMISELTRLTFLIIVQ